MSGCACVFLLATTLCVVCVCGCVFLPAFSTCLCVGPCLYEGRYVWGLGEGGVGLLSECIWGSWGHVWGLGGGWGHVSMGMHVQHLDNIK